MNLAIPRENNTELLLYIWKIIDLPYITLNNLLYKISYELVLIPPDKASLFVKDCLNNNLLTKDVNGKVTNLSSAGFIRFGLSGTTRDTDEDFDKFAIPVFSW